MTISAKDLDLAWGEYHHAERASTIALHAWNSRPMAPNDHPLLRHEMALARARVEVAKARLLAVRESLL